MLAFWLLTPPFNFLMKPPHYAHDMAMDIAVGLNTKEDGFSSSRTMQRPGMNIPTCKVDNEHWPDLAPYAACISVYSDPYRSGCGLFFKRDCVSLRGEAYLLQQPRLLANVLDAMEHPCRYLPTPGEIDQWTAMPATDDPAYNTRTYESMKSYYKEFRSQAQCDTNPDRYRGKVTLTLYDAKRPVYVIVRPKE